MLLAQREVPLANLWGGGEVASADGMRFVVPVHTVHAAPTLNTSRKDVELHGTT